MSSPVLVEIDSGVPVLRDERRPLVRVDEAGYLRGDGVFETVSVLHGRPVGLDEHLERLAASAEAIGLAIPEASRWSSALALAVEVHDALDDLTVRFVAASGSGSEARCTVHVSATPDSRSAREQGLSVIVLDRGYARGALEGAPWLLGGVKTTSGAVTRAALREATRRGADDVVWRTSDGLLLEGATSSLVLVADGVLTTPSTGGILAGTTVERVLALGAARGLAVARRELPVEALAQADAAWLVSSTRRAVPLRAVDGVPLRVDRDLTTAFEEGLLT
ncbi:MULTISPECIES: aminotransferase class IV [unclassified Rathayibacter]|uniref:aminotransferase class IV n=1 Tax=unclassified Rathayibacter TaxID=2609250 RepID=UPI00188B8DE8|nr:MULTISPECIES: aminotransferase class IV [unclassified Rathayibacter]MBF4462021.1 aminotransferase class IV [Rathayibacter sp. VKM Ac-2879]MBF4503936.1 aminotransferase class IV [Rathayibacter sp. VKM Ac-2878]